jgi:hypothetical protein
MIVKGNAALPFAGALVMVLAGCGTSSPGPASPPAAAAASHTATPPASPIPKRAEPGLLSRQVHPDWNIQHVSGLAPRPKRRTDPVVRCGEPPRGCGLGVPQRGAASKQAAGSQNHQDANAHSPTVCALGEVNGDASGGNRGASGNPDARQPEAPFRMAPTSAPSSWGKRELRRSGLVSRGSKPIWARLSGQRLAAFFLPVLPSSRQLDSVTSTS